MPGFWPAISHILPNAGMPVSHEVFNKDIFSIKKPNFPEPDPLFHSFGMTDIITLKKTQQHRLLSDFNAEAIWQKTFTKLSVFLDDLSRVDSLRLPMSVPNWEDCVYYSPITLILCNVIRCKYEYNLNKYKMYTYGGIYLFYCSLIFSVRKTWLELLCF